LTLWTQAHNLSPPQVVCPDFPTTTGKYSLNFRLDLPSAKKEGGEVERRPQNGLEAAARWWVDQPASPFWEPMLAFLNHKKQIEALRQDVDKLRKEFGNLELEWADMYDRMRRMLMKISKRQERLDAVEDTQPVEGEDAGDALTGASATSLSPHQQLVNSQILARRKKVNGGVLPR
jgi:hypothetical protein